VFGFLPGAYTGGLFGLKLAEFLWGHPIELTSGPRILAAPFNSNSSDSARSSFYVRMCHHRLDNWLSFI